MSIALKRALSLFAVICAAGAFAFCCLAGGVQWGTFTCGLNSVFILVVAIIDSGIVYAMSQA